MQYGDEEAARGGEKLMIEELVMMGYGEQAEAVAREIIWRKPVLRGFRVVSLFYYLVLSVCLEFELQRKGLRAEAQLR